MSGFFLIVAIEYHWQRFLLQVNSHNFLQNVPNICDMSLMIKRYLRDVLNVILKEIARSFLVIIIR